MIGQQSTLALALIVASVVPSPAAAQDGITRTIRIVTEPAADICEVRSSQLSCLGRSPAALQLEFRSAASARRLHLIRIGYETKRIVVSPNDAEVRATLRERSIYTAPRAEAAPAEKQVRSFVNERLRELFFGATPPEGLHGFEFLGAVGVAPAGAGKFEVIVPVMIEDGFRVKQLAAIERRFPAQERPAQTVRALWEGYVRPLAGALRSAFAREGRIGKVTVAASYSRTRYALVDDDTTFLSSRTMWTHSTTTGYGNVVQRVDHYRTTTFRLPTGYTKLAATKKIHVAVFVVPAPGRQDGPGARPRSTPPAMEEIAVLSNDNRSGELVEVNRPR